MKTYSAKAQEVPRKWWVIDANNQVLGQVAVKAANLLRGKEKAIYTPHVDTGDFVIVINAEKVRLTGKKEEQKSYMSFSGFVGGHKSENVRAPGPAPGTIGRTSYSRNDSAYQIGACRVSEAESLSRRHASSWRTTTRYCLVHILENFPWLKLRNLSPQARRKTSVARIRMTPGNARLKLTGKASKIISRRSRSKARSFNLFR
jgi:hypothetical protein